MNGFDNQMREKLINHSSPVPTDAWDKINAGLVKDTSGRSLAIYWMMGLFIILMVGLLAYYTLDLKNGELSIADTQEQYQPFHENAETYVVPMESESDTEPTNDDINNLIITKSSFKNDSKVDISDSTFIKNLKAIQNR